MQNHKTYVLQPRRIQLEFVLLERETFNHFCVRKKTLILADYIKEAPGVVLNHKNERIGDHKGIQFYTLGQRIPIGGLEEKYFIFKKDIENNIIYACPGTNNPLLYHDELKMNQFHWIDGEPKDWNDIYQIKVRYNQEFLVNCRIFKIGEEILVKSMEPLRSITPGQIGVIYKDNNTCLGGGTIIN